MKASSTIRKCAGIFPAFLALAAQFAAPCAWSQDTAFTYQGRLEDGGFPANGTYDMQFGIWDAAVGGTVLGGTNSFVGLSVSNGLFTVELDFGMSVFAGPNRWLEIAVQTNDAAGYTTLSPRTKITSTPYAIQALSSAGVPASSIGSSEVANESLTSSDLGPNSVGASEIAAGAVGSSEVANGSLTTDDLNLISVDARYVNVTGDQMTGMLSISNSITVLRLRASLNPMMEFYGGTSRKAWIQAFGNDLYISDDNAGNLRLRTSGLDRMIVDSTGRVGCGRQPTGSQLEVGGNTAVYSSGGLLTHYFGTATGGYQFIYNQNGVATMYLDGDNSLGGYLGVRNTNGLNRVVLDGYGPSGGGSAYLYADDGSTTLRLYGDDSAGAGMIEVNDSVSSTRVRLSGESVGTGGEISVFDNDGTETVEILGAESSSTGSQIALRKADGTTTILLDADFNGNGRVTTEELEITGGGDLSEQFDVAASGQGIRPGMLVSIDPSNPGKLVVSRRAYDRTVAGVVSGAGGIKPGLYMGQRNSAANGAHPIALTGRVYCLADASEVPIEPGDLITTSDIPGYGMKVSDPVKAQGAIVGKAMTPLKQGTGLVLVLVSLQ